MNSRHLFVWAPMVIASAIAVAFLRSPVEHGSAVSRYKNGGDAGSVSFRERLGKQAPLVSTGGSSSSATTQDLEPLLDRVQQLQQEIDAIKRQNGSTQAAAEQSSTADQEAVERERTTQITAFLESNFVAETKDPTWSLQAERQLSDTFNSDEIAAGSQLQQLSCQATLCRIESHHNDPAAERAFLTRVGRLNTFGDAEAFSERIEQADGSIEAVTYVSRNGHPLPRME
ncbi:MAG: hypothetical protein ABW034_19190 [Steroidobacteraceae bacterium]